MKRSEKNQLSLGLGSIITFIGGALLIRNSGQNEEWLIPAIIIISGLILAFIGAKRKW